MSATTSDGQPSTSTSIGAAEGEHSGTASQPSSSRTSTSRDQGDQTKPRPQVVGSARKGCARQPFLY
jgi:hypothetical protein